jgi:glycosyltransferase involved in cell wall biosynthesis
MRTAYGWAERVILNVPVGRASWLPGDRSRASFVPVGSNVPGKVRARPDRGGDWSGDKATVAVFGVTGGQAMSREVADIASAVKRATERVDSVSLIVCGRGSREAGPALRQAVNGARVEVSVLGLLPAEGIGQVLSQADVLLFVRGGLSSQRTSGIAGIACGLPIVGYEGAYTAHPVLDAGVMLVPYRDQAALGAALADVLSDASLRQKLRERSVEAYQRYFSWGVIAERFEAALRL